jgi:hypothetical protein
MRGTTLFAYKRQPVMDGFSGGHARPYKQTERFYVSGTWIQSFIVHHSSFIIHRSSNKATN